MKRCQGTLDVIDEAMKIVESDRRANPDETDTEYFSHPVSVEQRRAVMNFKKIFVIAIMMVTASAWTATVTDVTAKQRYPWNGLVDITCKVSGINGTNSIDRRCIPMKLLIALGCMG